ncbi:MAG: hypothetical protein ACLPQS_07005 [Acidimicrobiales bacterium]
MNEFVDECRREWQRLGVPDPVANEMAADLSADLEEAEAEGGSAEDVLGNSAFDPRRFAASWAVARGVTSQPTVDRPLLWRRPVAIALAAFLGVLTVSAGLILLVGVRSRSFAIAARPIRVFAPGPYRIAFPGPLGPFVGTQMASVVHPLALVLLIVGVVGLVLLAVFYWSPRSGLRQGQRHGGRRTRSWN